MPRIFAERRKAGELDIEAVELAFRTALHSAGAAGLSELLWQPKSVRTSVPCVCGGRARYRDMRRKPILEAAGDFDSRADSVDPACGNGLDVVLGIDHESERVEGMSGPLGAMATIVRLSPRLTQTV